jgi:hypothetical protein
VVFSQAVQNNQDDVQPRLSARGATRPAEQDRARRPGDLQEIPPRKRLLHPLLPKRIIVVLPGTALACENVVMVGETI